MTTATKDDWQKVTSIAGRCPGSARLEKSYVNNPPIPQGGSRAETRHLRKCIMAKKRSTRRHECAKKCENAKATLPADRRPAGQEAEDAMLVAGLSAPPQAGKRLTIPLQQRHNVKNDKRLRKEK